MNYPVFNPNELNGLGLYPTAGTNYGDPQFPVEKLQTPITPKENYLNFLEHKSFAWVPCTAYDINYIYPDAVPDNVACGYEGGIDAFGVKWVANPSNPWLPSFVEPGFTLLEDIADWEKLEWPDPDEWDWEGNAKLYECLDHSRVNWGIMLTSNWERMIDIMGFENAAMALLDDPESCHAFLDRLLTYNLKLIEKMHTYYHLDVILVHDDWGSQKAPFFSEAIIREFFMPNLKAQVEKAHSLGMKYVHHSCGNITSLVPVMIECGVDIWQFNYEAVKGTILDTIRTYGDKICFEGCFGFVEPLPEDDEEFLKAARQYYETFGKTGACTVGFYELRERPFDLRKVCYQYGRETAENL